MSFWIWKDNDDSEGQATLKMRPAVIRDQGLYFDDGVLLAHPEAGTALDIKMSEEEDGLLTDNLVAPALPGLLVSSRLRSVFDENGVDNIQYFPVNLTLSDGTVSSVRYFVANIVGRVACIDFERSDIVVSGDPMVVDAINSLVLHEDLIQDLDIFRLGELPVTIVVSSRLKNAIERSGVTGVAFYAVDEYVF